MAYVLISQAFEYRRLVSTVRFERSKVCMKKGEGYVSAEVWLIIFVKCSFL